MHPQGGTLPLQFFLHILTFEIRKANGNSKLRKYVHLRHYARHRRILYLVERFGLLTVHALRFPLFSITEVFDNRLL